MNIQAAIFIAFLFVSAAVMVYLIARLSLDNKGFDREIGRAFKSLGELSRSLKTDTTATLSPEGKIPASTLPPCTFQSEVWRRETEEEWKLRLEKQLQYVVAVRVKLQAKLKQGIDNRKAWERKALQSEEGDLS